MEKQTLLVFLVAAVTALVVAAAFGFAVRGEHGSRVRGRAVVGLLAGLIAGMRVASGGWPEPWPGQAADWMFHVAAGTAGALLVAGWARERWWARAVAAGVAGGVLVCWPALARIFTGLEPVETRWLWRSAVVLSTAGAAIAVAASYRRVDREAGARGDRALPIGVLIRDHHWPTAALGLLFGLGAPAMLFAAETAKLMQFGVALAGAWVGVACGAIGGAPGRTDKLSDAAVVAVVAYAGMWFTAQATGDAAPVWAISVGLGAAAALVIGTCGPLARRGGWTRIAIVSGLTLVLVGGVCLVLGPEYLRGVRALRESGR